MTNPACQSLNVPSTSETGLLLLYTGSPSHPDPACVAAYLREFLMDPCVMDMPGWLRGTLVKGVIVPLRARKSAAKYQSIWTPEGSPLTWYTQCFREALREQFPESPIASGAAYGGEPLQESLSVLVKASLRRLVVFSLFPHYARATRGSLRMLLEAALRRLGADTLELCEVPPFYAHPAYLEAMYKAVFPALEAFHPDHVVFSYHGLPLRQAWAPPDDGSGLNYEQQCLSSTEALVRILRLNPEQCTQAYQSRFGRGWLTPSTESVLVSLAGDGKRRVALIAPSFVTDCLETLEELDMEVKEAFLAAGGREFLRIPALNAHPAWVEGAACLVREVLRAEE